MIIVDKIKKIGNKILKAGAYLEDLTSVDVFFMDGNYYYQPLRGRTVKFEPSSEELSKLVDVGALSKDHRKDYDEELALIENLWEKREELQALSRSLMNACILVEKQSRLVKSGSVDFMIGEDNYITEGDYEHSYSHKWGSYWIFTPFNMSLCSTHEEKVKEVKRMKSFMNSYTEGMKVFHVNGSYYGTMKIETR